MNRCDQINCRHARIEKFLYLHPENKLKELFKDEKFLALLEKGKASSKQLLQDEEIHDIYSGKDYKMFSCEKGFLSYPYNISFTLNTDGVQKFKSTKAGNIWPVYLSINELPKEVRFKREYIIPAIVYCDKSKPNMVTLLTPLIDKVNEWFQNGIDINDIPVGDIHIHAILFLSTADLPARAKLMNMKLYNGKFSCHICKQEGTGYGKNNLHRAWPLKDIHLRSHEEQVSYASQGTQKNAKMGVKGASAFFGLENKYNFVNGFATDWMHCGPLGVVKYITDLMLSEANKGKECFIRHKLTMLNKRLLSIRPPNIIGQFSRSLTETVHWKATEFKNWLLHYSVLVLYGILPPVYLIHWSLLVASLGILNSEKINKVDINNAKAMLKDFVYLVTPLYGLHK